MPPTLLIDSLQTLRRKMKVFAVVYGTGIVIASAVALLLAVVLLDWVLALPAPLRVAVNLAALGTLAYAMYHWIGREAVRKQTLSDLAGRLEHAFPQFDDTLRSTVDFVHPTRGEIHGSEVMKQRTVAEASRRAQDVNLHKALVLRPVWYSAAAGLGAVVLMASLVSLASHKFPEFLRIAANHLIGGAEPWPKSVEIDMVGSVPHRVAVGQHLDVRMRLKKGNVAKAVVKYRLDNGPWQNQVIQRGEDGTFAAGLDATTDGAKDLSKLQIRLEAGDDQRDLNVDVVPRLDIKGVTAFIQPPPYADLKPTPVNISERPAVAVIGSEVDLKVSFNKPLDASKGVRLDAVDHGRPAPAVKWAANGDQAVGHFVASDGAFHANDPFKFTIHATDQDGFENSGSQEFTVIVHDDALPTVQIEEPRQSEDRTPDATVPLKVVAEDDFGIDVAQLVVTRVNGKAGAPGSATRPAGATTLPASAAPQHWVIELHNKTVNAPGVNWSTADSSSERKRFRLEFPWDLGKMENANLKPGDELEFFVQVKDNFSLPGVAPHPFVPSPKLKIIIISQDQFQIIVENVLAQMKNEIGAIKRSQDSTHDENVGQSKETQERQKFDDAQRATVDRLASQQSTAASQAKQASQKLQDLLQKMAENKSPEKATKDTVDQVAKELEQTSEGAMKQATSQLDQAKETKSDPKSSPAQQKQDAQKAAEAMDKAASNQEQASKELEQAMNKLSDFGGLTSTIEKMQKIADHQKGLDDKYKKGEMKDALGKKADELTAEQKKELDKETKEQDELKKQTEEALNQMEAKAEKMAKSDEKSSKAMKSAAQTGKQQGIPQKQQQASQDMQQNQQANAQNSQKQVELGLEMILEKLKEAQKHQLAELQAKLAELQQRVDELILRQSGHNLDDLWLQDNTGKKIAALTEQDQKNLFEWSKRDPKIPFTADLAVLTPAQEQTQRTCRDVAEKAGTLPDPAAGTKLIAASTKMEQAIVYLRKTQLAEAYSPNQVEALALLQDAKKAIDEAKKKVEDQQREQQEETIKQAYVKLLEEQKKIDVETHDIDATPKDNDGNLPFLLARRLGQLPDEQGKLSKDATELGKKLEGLNSVVYVWANKDIVSSMDEVKDDLAKPATGVPTQSEQKRIEDQLKAMIDNLAQKKQDKPFVQKNGGGGGGGGKPPPPRMPTDVELRLLKDLQIAVNRSTNKISAEKEKDAHKLLALGGRQGELRGVLDQLLQKSTQGKVKLDKEPENKDLLPEEVEKDAIDDQLVNNLLDDNAGADDLTKKVKTLGDREGRSRQRLAVNNDPGKTTQEVQKKIVDQLDELIQLAQKQQQQGGKGKGQGQPKPGDPNGPPQPGQGEGPQKLAKGQGQGQKSKNHNESGQSPADEGSLTDGGDPQVDASRTIKELNKEWGNLSPRERQAVMEGASEKSFAKYRKFIDDYYRELAKKAAER